MNLESVHTFLQTVAKFVNDVRDNVAYYTTKSLPESTKLTRVEPLTIISKDLLNLEYMPDVSQTLLSMFSGYYLQAVAMLTKINDVEVVRILDKLNPDRDETGFLLQERIDTQSLNNFVLENYRYSLPTAQVVSLENDNDNVKQLNEITALSVGKLLNVQLQYVKEGEEKSKTVTVPVSVRLMASVIPTASIQHLLTYKTDDNSLVERFHAWRSGRISFIRDLIFCQDLIDEYKKATIGDESGTMAEIVRRVNNAKKYGLLAKNPSLVSASNIFVISEEVAREIENRLGGKLSNPRIRQKAFENTYAMIIAVVDREWERVTFYSRGINASTDLSIKEIKAASKSKGPDIMDLMKSYQLGSQVTF